MINKNELKTTSKTQTELNTACWQFYWLELIIYSIDIGIELVSYSIDIAIELDSYSINIAMELVSYSTDIAIAIT